MQNHKVPTLRFEGEPILIKEVNGRRSIVVNWQGTATTIYCDDVDDEVTIGVNKDWTKTCTGHRKYVGGIDKETARMLKKKA